MSVLLTPALAVSEALFLTTAAAAAALDAIDAVRTDGYGADFSPIAGKTTVKWVNDIYLDDRKVCGILAEAALCPGTDRLAYAVVGIGVNVSVPADGFDASIADTAGALFVCDAENGGASDALLGSLAAEITDRLARYLETNDRAAVLRLYRERSLLHGREVLVRPTSSLGGAEYPARVTGIDDAFGLCVTYPDGTTDVLSSGEVVLQDGCETVQSARASVRLT